MVLIVSSANNVGSGIRVDLGVANDLWVLPGVTVGSTDDRGVRATGTGQVVYVEGNVVGQIAAISFADDPGKVVVMSSGFVFGWSVGIFGGGAIRVENAGHIEGGNGILNLVFGAATTDILNTGSIIGSERGISVSDSLTLTNRGLVSGAEGAIRLLAGTAQINNFGQIVGNIALAGGDDLYVGSTGTLVGLILAGFGQDTLSGGAATDIFLGEDDDDTLDGNGGKDDLQGGAGNDLLVGGTGIDQLIGGDDFDRFRFEAPRSTANRDTILDFNRVQDTIQLENAVFTRLAPGTLGAAAFRLGAAAADPTDRVVYNRATGAVFHDPDGNGPVKQVQFATLQNKPVINNLDFFVI